MHRNRPMVTVLMSVFNGRRYVREAIESILTQTFRDFEFLIIDDGSTEPFDDIVDQYKDARVVLVHQENLGLTRSLNRGLGLAQGEFVARMDADDVSLPDRLESQVQAFEEDAELDLVGTFFDVVNASGDLIERKELIIDPVYRLWRLQFHNNYGHGTVMMRKTTVSKAGGYDERLSYAQDYDLWCRISAKANTRIIPKVLYRYRMVESSSQASVRNYDAQLVNAIRISDRNLIKCNPSLGEAQCVEVRALYWKFQRENFSMAGLEHLPETLDGFCARFTIEGDAKKTLVERVAQDCLEEVTRSSALSASEKRGMSRFIHERFRTLESRENSPMRAEDLS